MPWPVYFAHFLGGVFLANALPHLIAGVTGRSAPTPFASPPFRGRSSPAVNVAWASANLAAAYLLLVRVRPLDLHGWADAAVAFMGFAAMAFLCARAFGRLSRPAADDSPA
jgi:hypothetical protein